MRLYPKYPSAISALSFSPDGTRLAIGVSYEHDNAVPPAEQKTVMLLLKETVMDDCKVGSTCARTKANGSPRRGD